jgi:hypothetical protein
VEKERGCDDDIDVSSGRGSDWVGHFSPVPYGAQPDRPSKTINDIFLQLLLGCENYRKQSQMTRQYHTQGLQLMLS